MPLPRSLRHLAEAKLEAFCDSRIPAHVKDKIRLEVTFRGANATLFERRPPWRPENKHLEWSKMPIAQFRYDPATELWALFWCNRNGRWFANDEIAPSPDINILIDEVDNDPTHIFWG